MLLKNFDFVSKWQHMLPFWSKINISYWTILFNWWEQKLSFLPKRQPWLPFCIVFTLKRQAMLPFWKKNPINVRSIFVWFATEKNNFASKRQHMLPFGYNHIAKRQHKLPFERKLNIFSRKFCLIFYYKNFILFQKGNLGCLLGLTAYP